MSGPTNTTPIITNSSSKIIEEKRCTTPVTVTYFGHNDSGKLEKVVLPSLDGKKQPLSLTTTDIDLEENELSSLSPKSLKSPQEKRVFFEENGNGNPFVGCLNPFHESNPFNPFREGDNSDGQSEPESLNSRKEV